MIKEQEHNSRREMKEWFQDISIWLFASVMAGVGWIVRNVLTNNKQIEILKTNLEAHYAEVVKEHKYLREAINREVMARTEDAREARALNQQLVALFHDHISKSKNKE